MLLSLLLAGVVGYLLGSLPFGYLVARAKGVNIFEVGSRSSGATNVRRVLGNGPGFLVLLLDAAKGAAAASPSLFHADWQVVGLVGLLGALVGHAFSCFTGFRGGKSVATAAGGFLVLFPIGVLAAAVVWGLTVAATRYVSLASMLAAVGLTVTAAVLRVPLVLLLSSAAVTVFVIVRHRANISRLLAGTESKIGQKPAHPSP